MKRLRHVVRATVASFRVAIMMAVQYRASFVAEAVVSVFWLAWTIVPLFVLFRFQRGVAGWSQDEALVVVGFFITLSGVLDAFVDPNLSAVVQHVRQGTLDYVLLKPIDAQLLVSVHRTAPSKLPHVLAGVIVAVIAAARLPRAPGAADLGAAFLLLGAGTAILYSLWTMVVSLSFKFVRVDNLSYLLRTFVDAGRWPTAFYPVVVRFVLTFIVPVGLMTTYPALALRGALSTSGLALALGVALAFFGAARIAWTLAVRRYASASS
ncbi:MAG TPA: ABC-2 family transporter protein [Polyangiaceae bacterium]|jgi:ABC-2 type transport system permease protein|nr:ABC-2 family transporter protein [Polyangiaceae bacterium]